MFPVTASLDQAATLSKKAERRIFNWITFAKFRLKSKLDWIDRSASNEMPNQVKPRVSTKNESKAKYQKSEYLQ